VASGTPISKPTPGPPGRCNDWFGFIYLERPLCADRIPAHPPAAALLGLVVLGLVRRLARDDGGEQSPVVVTVLQVREASPVGTPAEAGEGAEGHVLLVGHAPRRGPQLLERQLHQPRVVALPKRLGGQVVAGLELFDQQGDRLCRRHGRFLRPLREGAEARPRL
jgi:hypothetical protein